MYLTASDDFADIAWDAPEQAKKSWIADRQHCPAPVPPLAVGMFARWVTGAMGGQLIAINGYAFMSTDVFPRPRNFEQPAVAAWDELNASLVREPARAIREQPYDETSPAAAFAAFEDALERSAEAFRFTMEIMGALMPAIGPLFQLSGRALGDEGPLEALTIARSGANVTLDSALELERLADVAAADPALAAALRSPNPMETLATAPGGEPFLRNFNAYLAEHGWRAENWIDIHRPLWVEAPENVLAVVRKYLDNPGQRPSNVIAAARASSEAAAARLRAALPDAAAAEEFERLLPRLDGAIRVIEERAALQQMTFASMKVPVLAVGRSLTAAGRLDAPGDVFYLTQAELQDLCSESARPVDARELVRRRRGDLERWAHLIPPATVGAKSPPMPVAFGGPPPAGEPGQVRGLGASRGVATGRAFVARSLEEAEQVEPGDILICGNTSPPWTPLFAIVGGIVCDAGGILGHAAITAREYGIPAVLGTVTGTRDIPHGTRVTIDGAAGIVTIHADGEQSVAR